MTLLELSEDDEDDEQDEERNETGNNFHQHQGSTNNSTMTNSSEKNRRARDLYEENKEKADLVHNLYVEKQMKEKVEARRNELFRINTDTVNFWKEKDINEVLARMGTDDYNTEILMYLKSKCPALTKMRFHPIRIPISPRPDVPPKYHPPDVPPSPTPR